METARLLVESWPLSVRVDDAQGRAPLELAVVARSGDSSLDVLYYLVARWAEVGLS